MALDLFRTDDAYVATLDLPGVTPTSIEVDVDGTLLTVRAERTRPADDVRWIVRGRRSGTVVRRFTLGDGVDSDRIAASYVDGVLTLTVPVAEKARPRRIEVSGVRTGELASAA